MTNGRRVLVTGASGFIGRAVIPLLTARGFDVHAVSRANATGPAVCHRTDLLADDVDAMLDAVRPDLLLHLAWYAQPEDYRVSTENARWLEASRRLASSFVRHGGTRAVFAGTCAETTEPATPYAESKRALRDFVSAMPLSVAWGRIFFLFGPHEYASRFVPSIVLPLLRDQEAFCLRPALRRDFLYVEDVAAAFVAMLEGDATGDVEIGSGDAVRLGSVAETIAARVGRGVLRQGSDDAGERPVIVADVRRLRDELGFRPRYSLLAGIDATIDWWRAEMERR
jgi:nucleoside-diphosphate-sugar epimerase